MTIKLNNTRITEEQNVSHIDDGIFDKQDKKYLEDKYMSGKEVDKKTADIMGSHLFTKQTEYFNSDGFKNSNFGRILTKLIQNPEKFIDLMANKYPGIYQSANNITQSITKQNSDYRKYIVIIKILLCLQENKATIELSNIHNIDGTYLKNIHLLNKKLKLNEEFIIGSSTGNELLMSIFGNTSQEILYSINNNTINNLLRIKSETIESKSVFTASDLDGISLNSIPTSITKKVKDGNETGGNAHYCTGYTSIVLGKMLEKHGKAPIRVGSTREIKDYSQKLFKTQSLNTVNLNQCPIGSLVTVQYNESSFKTKGVTHVLICTGPGKFANLVNSAYVTSTSNIIGTKSSFSNHIDSRIYIPQIDAFPDSEKEIINSYNEKITLASFIQKISSAYNLPWMFVLQKFLDQHKNYSKKMDEYIPYNTSFSINIPKGTKKKLFSKTDIGTENTTNALLFGKSVEYNEDGTIAYMTRNQALQLTKTARIPNHAQNISTIIVTDTPPVKIDYSNCRKEGIVIQGGGTEIGKDENETIILGMQENNFGVGITRPTFLNPKSYAIINQGPSKLKQLGGGTGAYTFVDKVGRGDKSIGKLIAMEFAGNEIRENGKIIDSEPPNQAMIEQGKKTIALLNNRFPGCNSLITTSWDVINTSDSYTPREGIHVDVSTSRWNSAKEQLGVTNINGNTGAHLLG